MNLRRLWLVKSAWTAGAIAMTLGVAACGGSSTSTSTATPRSATVAASSSPASSSATSAPVAAATNRTTEPCSYLTVAEVQTATGKTVVGDPVRVNDFSCGYHTSEQGVVTIVVSSPVAKDRFEQGVQANHGSTPVVPIPGLGDDAFEIFFGVAVWKSPAISISVEVSPSPTQTGGDAAIAIARLLLQRV